MISDDDLYRISLFLGCSAMILIVLYHYIDINVRDGDAVDQKVVEEAVAPPAAKTAGKHVAGKRCRARGAEDEG